MTLAHETLTFERRFDATPARVFRAYTDPEVRMVWSAPSDGEEVQIDHAEVRTGGQERARCGPKGDLKWTMKVAYHWVETDRLIHFTEELWEGDCLLTVAQITFDIAAAGSGSRLTVTDQLTSFVGADAVDGHRKGYPAALDHLGLLLGPAPGVQ